MTDESSAPPHSAPTRGRDVLVWWSIVVGSILAVAGVVIGFVMAFKRNEAECADGTYFPEGTTDFRCFVHPQGLEGSAIAVISLMLGILIVLTSAIAKSTFASSTDRR